MMSAAQASTSSCTLPVMSTNDSFGRADSSDWSCSVIFVLCLLSRPFTVAPEMPMMAPRHFVGTMMRLRFAGARCEHTGLVRMARDA